MNAAAALQAPEGNEEAADQGQYLTFLLGAEVFAIGILIIKEIIEYGSLTEVPMMPACIRGVINLRGSVVPVMDLSVRFGRKASPVTTRTCVVIVETNSGDKREVRGVIVDAVSAVVEIPSSQVEAPPAFGARIRSDYLEGLGKVDGQFVILLDVNRVLELEESLCTEQNGPSNPASIAAPIDSTHKT